EPAHWYKADPVADGESLPLLTYLFSGMNVESNQVLQPVIAVHAAAVLPDLDQPSPDLVSRRVNGNGPGSDNRRLRNELITRERRFLLRIR
ncbi:MAG TPA: hypothetical protein VN648_03505, partial [Candidatus Methylomirabilis sp.]|nr:hypothetical protein [Candidatus Methylomirabilis sp.]